MSCGNSYQCFPTLLLPFYLMPLWYLPPETSPAHNNRALLASHISQDNLFIWITEMYLEADVETPANLWESLIRGSVSLTALGSSGKERIEMKMLTVVPYFSKFFQSERDHIPWEPYLGLPQFSKECFLYRVLNEELKCVATGDGWGKRWASVSASTSDRITVVFMEVRLAGQLLLARLHLMNEVFGYVGEDLVLLSIVSSVGFLTETGHWVRVSKDTLAQTLASYCSMMDGGRNKAKALSSVLPL